MAVQRFSKSTLLGLTQGRNLSAWNARANATNASYSQSGGYGIWTFSTGSGTFTPVYNVGGIDYLLVGGGGGTQSGSGAGAGAGGYLSLSAVVTANTTYNVTVGVGGVKNGGTKGTDSTAFSQTAFGGGVGGSTSATINGGSGGGWGNGNGSGGSAVAGQGNNGGNGVTGQYGGGGGGAAQAGNVRGNGKGGNGLNNSISGTSLPYAGGGNWAFQPDSLGGLGDNPGSGASSDGPTNGGNGILIIRYVLGV